MAGLYGRPRQGFRAAAGVVSVITAVIAGSAAGHAAAVEFDHSLVATLVSGATIAIVALVLIRSQRTVWTRAAHAAPAERRERPSERERARPPHRAQEDGSCGLICRAAHRGLPVGRLAFACSDRPSSVKDSQASTPKAQLMLELTACRVVAELQARALRFVRKAIVIDLAQDRLRGAGSGLAGRWSPRSPYA